MRHKVAGKRLSRSTDHRKALRRTMVNQLFTHERIKTTRARAQAIRGQAERLITLAKKGNAADEAQMVHARRLASARMGDPEMVQKLFDDIAPRYEDRPGGYTRILKLGPRYGDSAEMVIIELIEE
ncbi:MAG: 50S ribosomal protein L17 [Chloroflexota bacterium]|nr:MAG: 50S ribosomal protein L17 [Chloroflexota bacterium]UCF28204.1 MAG: 50S ribosomal protein L17 [Chloroflexota bacterium]